jgi:hypothetical protein
MKHNAHAAAAGAGCRLGLSDGEATFKQIEAVSRGPGGAHLVCSSVRPACIA